MNRLDVTYILSKAKKIKAINLLGGKCIACGDNNIAHLSFHHHNDDKEYNPCGLLQTARWTTIESEIMKCILMCHNCHRESHVASILTNRRRNKKILLEAISKFECEKCGYNKCYNALDFHHIDKSNKEFSLSNFTLDKCISNVGDVTQIILDELDKCIVICSNCHRDIHFDWDRYHKFESQILDKVYNYKEIPIIDEQTIKNILKMHSDGFGYKKIMNDLNCSKATISKYINLYK